MQLGTAGSETAAQSVFASFQRKYSDLEGMPSMIRKAEVNGSTVYRVRVGPLPKEEASSSGTATAATVACASRSRWNAAICRTSMR